MERKTFIILLAATIALASCSTRRRVPGGYTWDELQRVRESEILSLENIALNGTNEIKIQVGDDDGFIIENRKCAIFIFLDGLPDDFEDCSCRAEDLVGRKDIGIIRTKTDGDGWIFIRNVPGEQSFILGVEK